MLSPARRWRRFWAMSDRDERDVSVVGRGAHVEGSLVSTGSLWIAGRMTGEISVEGQVTVAPDSEVEADIKAGSINLAGRVNGNLTAPGSVELSGARERTLGRPSSGLERSFSSVTPSSSSAKWTKSLPGRDRSRSRQHEDAADGG